MGILHLFHRSRNSPPEVMWLSSNISKHVPTAYGPNKHPRSDFNCSLLYTLLLRVCARQAAQSHLGVSHVHTQVWGALLCKWLWSLSMVIILILDLEPKMLLTHAAFLIYKGFRFQHPLSFSFFSTWALKDQERLEVTTMNLQRKVTKISITIALQYSMMTKSWRRNSTHFLLETSPTTQTSYVLVYASCLWDKKHIQPRTVFIQSTNFLE